MKRNFHGRDESDCNHSFDISEGNFTFFYTINLLLTYTYTINQIYKLISNFKLFFYLFHSCVRYQYRHSYIIQYNTNTSSRLMLRDTTAQGLASFSGYPTALSEVNKSGPRPAPQLNFRTGKYRTPCKFYGFYFYM